MTPDSGKRSPTSFGAQLSRIPITSRNFDPHLSPVARYPSFARGHPRPGRRSPVGLSWITDELTIRACFICSAGRTPSGHESRSVTVEARAACWEAAELVESRHPTTYCHLTSRDLWRLITLVHPPQCYGELTYRGAVQCRLHQFRHPFSVISGFHFPTRSLRCRASSSESAIIANRFVLRIDRGAVSTPSVLRCILPARDLRHAARRKAFLSQF